MLAKSRLRCLLRGSSGFAFERRADAALDHAIADADELENRTGAGIAEPRHGELHDPGVAAGAIDKTGRDFSKQNANRLLVAD